MVQEREPNNNFAQAQNLGSLEDNSSRDVTGTVSLEDVNDVYKFDLRNASSNLELVLEQNSNNNSDADLELFRDANRNNVLDKGDFIINAFEQPQGDTKRLQLDGLGAGTYFARVRMDRGSDVGRGPINYQLTVRADSGKQNEQEPNDSLLQAENIKGFLNGQRQIVGSVNKADDVFDFYKFELEVPSKVFASISTADSNNLNFFLGRDFNNNGSLETNELIYDSLSSSTAKTKTIRPDRLEPGTYYLQISASNASSGTIDYNLFVSANPIRQEELTVEIMRLTAIDSFDTGSKADFRINLDVGRNTGKNKKFDEQNDVFPDFEVTDLRTSEFYRFIPIEIKVKEEDDPFPDDNVDIQPFSGNSLALNYDTLTGEILQQGQGEVVGLKNDLITLEGNGNRRAKRARIEFQVRYRTRTFN